MDERVFQFRVGVTVLAAVLITGILMLLFGGRVTLGGETLTTTWGTMVIELLAFAAGFAWLVTLSVTGFGDGTAPGAT